MTKASKINVKLGTFSTCTALFSLAIHMLMFSKLTLFRSGLYTAGSDYTVSGKKTAPLNDML